MNKLYMQNLAMIITNQCNLNCSHCLRGTKNNHCISDNIIEATLNQMIGVGNLSICGGEPTLAIDRLEKIISYIIEKQILIEEFAITINGTIYSKELLELLDEINTYIGNNGIHTLLAISLDKYHLEQIKKLGIQKEFYENLRKYQESKFFYGYRATNKKLFREGNATNLDKKLTVPLRPLKPLITYADKTKKFNKENGLCNIGPLVTVNSNGIITECNASIEHQETLYNYGNVLNDTIENIILEQGELILSPKKFEKKTNQLLKKYATYNR